MPQQLYEIRKSKWLANKACNLLVNRVHGHFPTIGACQKHSCVRPNSPNFRYDFTAGGARYGHVQQKQIDVALMTADKFHGGGAVSRLDYQKAFPPEHNGDGLAEWGLVFDQKHG